MELTFEHCLLKIVGVFSYDHKTHNAQFRKAGYDTIPKLEIYPEVLEKLTDNESRELQDNTSSNYKNIYYSEFRDFMFTGKDRKDADGYRKEQIRLFQRDKNLEGVFVYKEFNREKKIAEEKNLRFLSKRQEIYLFPDGIGIFSITLTPLENTMNHLSQLINRAKSFATDVKADGGNIPFHNWVSREMLMNIPLSGEDLESDEYSGSKFKVYTIIDMPPPSVEMNYNRDHLLYEIGTSSPIGCVAGNGFNKPSDSYYEELMQNKLSAFHNYEGLALLDSFTIIGSNNYRPLNADTKDFRYHNWNRVYFGIYMYNLFVRYSLFKFNAQFLSDPVKYRDKFQRFLNNYDFRHISFNFLPNIVFDRIRKSLGINEEIEVFEKRLSNLAASIQEDQEKRQAFLLTLISVISAFDAAEAILIGIDNIRTQLHLSAFLFYPIFIIILLVAASFLFRYLFPHLAKKVERYIRNKFKGNHKK